MESQVPKDITRFQQSADLVSTFSIVISTIHLTFLTENLLNI
jgi:hypothetical protein